MDKNQDNERQLLKNLEDELYSETFLKDEPEFSPKKVEHIVGLLELDRPTNEQEMEDSLKDFEERFQKLNRKAIRKNKIKKYCNKLAGIAAVLMLIFMAADITTNAVMDESLFHMVYRWKNRIEIIPGIEDEEKESSDFAEGEVKYFNSVEEFAEYFGDNFLICSWLPENVELKEIYVNDMNKSPQIVWEYNDEHLSDWNMHLWMQQKGNNEATSFVETSIEDSSYENYVNGNKITYFRSNDGLLAGFEYEDWWYLISIPSFEEDVLNTIIEGIVEYE